MARLLTVAAFMLLCALGTSSVLAEYKATTSRKDLKVDEVAVSKAGSYADAGKTYVLTADISSAMTPIFLGKDVTLDLNGHAVTFADGKYEHIPNYGFDEDLKGWDVSRARGAKVLPSSVRPMVGEKILELKAGDEIVSSYGNQRQLQGRGSPQSRAKATREISPGTRQRVRTS